ncbi:MAG TPA: YtcA family lipoprotein [Candidatus Eisenbacteria bacterium]|nr:YtcA family lipoprotein [Candidatus Eisenbacteria bacterium]
MREGHATSLPRKSSASSRALRPPCVESCRAYRRGLAVAGLLVAVPGCGLAPSVNILGSFFPAWLISIVIGVVLTIVTRQVFIALGIASQLSPAPLVYLALAGFWIFATWLLLFGS